MAQQGRRADATSQRRLQLNDLVSELPLCFAPPGSHLLCFGLRAPLLDTAIDRDINHRLSCRACCEACDLAVFQPAHIEPKGQPVLQFSFLGLSNSQVQ